LIVNPDPELVALVVLDVLLVVVDFRLDAEVGSISEPPPRATPASCVVAVLVPNASSTDTVTEQSVLTL